MQQQHSGGGVCTCFVLTFAILSKFAFNWSALRVSFALRCMHHNDQKIVLLMAMKALSWDMPSFELSNDDVKLSFHATKPSATPGDCDVP